MTPRDSTGGETGGETMRVSVSEKGEAKAQRTSSGEPSNPRVAVEARDAGVRVGLRQGHDSDTPDNLETGGHHAASSQQLLRGGQAHRGKARDAKVEQQQGVGHDGGRSTGKDGDSDHVGRGVECNHKPIAADCRQVHCAMRKEI